jgi:NADH-quinone oxidoreductase subunit L
MDWLYDRVFVRPLEWLARIDKQDFIDSFYDAIQFVTQWSWRVLRRTENGRLRWYAAGVTAGTVIFIAIALWA